MFYSQLLLSKTGALGVVWLAAHCHKRLRKCDIQKTDISSSVDKILDGEVGEVTHRILAFLLLGIVRIYSRKAEYLFNDCHEMLNRLSTVVTKKNKQAETRVSQTHYYSISLPNRFELDMFDLELLEDQDVASANVRPCGNFFFTDNRGKDTKSVMSVRRKENAQITEAHSMAYTPPRDVFGHTYMSRDLLIGPSSNKKFSLAGVEALRGNTFSLVDQIDPNLLDKAEDEQMLEKQTDGDSKMNFLNDKESDSDVGSPNYERHLLPSSEVVCGTWFSLEDCLEPMVLDEGEKEEFNLRRPSAAFHNIEQINEAEKGREKLPDKEDEVAEEQLEHLDTALNFENDAHHDFTAPIAGEKGEFNHRPSSVLHNIEQMNEAEKGRGDKNLPDKEHEVAVEQSKHLDTALNFENDAHHDFTASIDKAKTVNEEGDKVAAGAGTSDVPFVQTPGRKERAKIPLKKKTPFDLTTTVVPNKEFKNWLDDTTDLKRKRRDIPRTLLAASRANKRARFPRGFLETSIPGISVELACSMSYTAAAPEAIETSNKERTRVQEQIEISNKEDTNSRVQEQNPVVKSPSREMSPRRNLDVEPPADESPKHAPIAPGTPSASHLDQIRSNDFGAVADSDMLEPPMSYESIVKGPSLSEPLGSDDLFKEDTSSSEGDSIKKGDQFSTRTRMAASYLRKKFLDKRNQEEEQVLSLSHLLARKTNKESARFFYETLVLKTRDCIDVQQDAAYHDILLCETSKLRHILDS